jgi:ferrous iron transport protein B
MTTTQIMVFTLFIIFYIPCLATIAALVKEIGRKLAALAMLYSLAVATLIGLVARFFLEAFAR